MIEQAFLRRLAIRLLTGFALTGVMLSAPIVVGSFSQAQAQVSAEFQEALTPYGSWRRHARWGEVWVPSRRASDWRPYEAGHWVYTDEWGWFWDTDDTEADWGWITYHYGRWMHDQTGWFWIPGEEWAPAWVDWRYSDDYVGWAPLPPDDVAVEYESEPAVWVFVAPRYLTEPRWRTYVAPPQRRVTIFRSSRIVNRTVVFSERGRAAVNPGISPAFIASVTHRPVQSYRVRPNVLASTRGVSGAVTVRARPNGARGGRSRTTTVTRVSVQKTNVVIKPEAKAPTAPQALGKDERGRLGNRPPRAAQGATPAAAQPAGRPAAPNGQQRPVTPAAPSSTAPATTPAKPVPGAPAAAPQTRPAAPAATPAKPEPAKPATPPREERRGPPSGAAPGQREERREDRAAPPKAETPRTEPPKAEPAKPAAPRAVAPRPAAPRPPAPAAAPREERRAAPPAAAPVRPAAPPAARPQPPAPPRPAAPPPAARPAPPPPPAQRAAPPPQAPKPPAAARPAPAKPAAPAAPAKPEEKK